MLPNLKATTVKEQDAAQSSNLDTTWSKMTRASLMRFTRAYNMCLTDAIDVYTRTQ